MLLKYKSKGISLVEVLAAMLISVIIIAAAIVFFIDIRNVHRIKEDELHRNIKALKVEQVLDHAMANVGMFCPAGTEHLSSYELDGKSMYDDTGDGLSVVNHGIVSTGSQESVSIGSNLTNMVENTDYLAIQRSEHYSLITDVDGVSLTLKNTIEGLEEGDYVVSCNRRSVEVLKAISVSDNEINLNTDITNEDTLRSIDVGDFIGDYQVNVYYIRAVKDDAGNTIAHSLYLLIRSAANNAMSYELIRGVDNLHIQLVKASEINVGEQVSWQDVVGMTTIDSSYKAIKISFDIVENDTSQRYSQIIPVRVV